MTICLVSLRLICLRYLIEMHSTKVLVCKQACRMLAVQHASYIVPGKGGMHQRGESTFVLGIMIRQWFKRWR